MRSSCELTLVAQGSTPWQRFIRRWGLSFLVGDDVLFDTFGDPGVFLRNLARLKVDISRIRHIVISHDHWDHVSGLWPFLEKHREVAVYICPGFSQDTKKRLSSTGAKIIEVRDQWQIRDGLFSTGPISGRYAEEKIEEQALVVRAGEGWALVTGCAHPGITNILEQVIADFGRPVRWVIGGFHLKDSTPAEIEKIALRLKELGVESIVPLHCTGKAAGNILRKVFAGKKVCLKERGSLRG